MGGRREEAKGGTRRRRDTAFARCVWNGHWVRCGRGGLVFLALARSAARRLGDSAARRLVGSQAQWERPRNRSHVAARDRTTKPSWGSDAQAELRRVPAFLSMEVSLKKVITKKLDLDRGCLWSSKETKLFVWPFWGASTPVPSSSPPALLRRARLSRSRRRAPRRRHARFQEIIELDCNSLLKVSAACGSCEARSARSLALAMHPATSRRRPRERKVPHLPRRKSPLQQVCQNL